MCQRPQRADWSFIGNFPRTQLISLLLLVSANGLSQTPAPAWRGVLQDETAHPVAQAKVELNAGEEHKEAATNQDGVFLFGFLPPKTYHVAVDVNGRVHQSSADISLPGSISMN